MHTLVRSSLVVAGLMVAGCGGESAGSPSTTPAMASTTVPATSSTVRVVNEFALAVAINDVGQVLMGDRHLDGSRPSSVVVIDTGTGHRREMPTEGAEFVWGTGLNDAGLVAGDISAGSGPCPTEGPCATEGFVWDSVGGALTRLPDFWVMAGPNEAGLVVVASQDRNEVSVLETTSGELTLLEGGDQASSFDINNRGQFLGTLDAGIVVWDTVSGTREVLPTLDWSVLRTVGIDNDGRVVANGYDVSFEHACFVWEPTDRQWHQFPRTDPTRCRNVSAVSDDGLVAEVVNPMELGEIRVWDLATGELSYSAKFDVHGVTFSHVSAINDKGQLIADVHDTHSTGDVSTRSYFYDPTTDTWTELLLDV